MTMKHPFNVFEYDQLKYPFRDVFSHAFSTHDLDNYLISTSKTQLIEEGYKVLKGPKFTHLYTQFLAEIAQFIDDDFYYQAIPTLRVQKKNDKAVTFHVDEWSGHGRTIKNFWIPLVDLNSSNCLSLIPEDNTKALIHEFQKNELPLADFELKCRRSASQLPLRYGQAVQFGNNNLHGSSVNESDSVRLSFDFRILKRYEDPGIKSIRSYYRPFGFKPSLVKPVIAIVYCTKDVSHLSHVAQRSVINEYCAKNDFDIYIENNELLQVNHYPVISLHLESSNKPLVIFSLRCLPINKMVRNNLIKRMRAYSHGVHFALENKQLMDIDSSYIDKLMHPDNVFA